MTDGPDPRTRMIAGAGGIGLSVYEWGDPTAGPTIVLVHGYPDDHAVWNPVARRLAARHHVVAYDVRGAGASGRPSERAAYRLDTLALDLAAVLDATAAGRPAHVVAHDWGSIAGWHAVAHEALTGRVASYTSISGPSLANAAHWMRTAPLRARLRQFSRSWYIMAMQVPGLVPGAWRLVLAGRWPRALARMGLETGDGWPAAHQLDDAVAGVNLYRANMLGRLARPEHRPVLVPVQVIVPLDDPFVDPRLASCTAPAAPSATVHQVPGGHWILRSDPDRIAGLVADHVAASSPRQP